MHSGLKFFLKIIYILILIKIFTKLEILYILACLKLEKSYDDICVGSSG